MSETQEIPEFKLILRRFNLEQKAKARPVGMRRDEIGLDEAIVIVDRVIADYLDLKEKLVLLRA